MRRCKNRVGIGVTKEELSNKIQWGRLWGELEDEPQMEGSITRLVPAEMCIPKPYIVQGPHDDTPDHPILRPPENRDGENVVLHCIDLIRHNRAITAQKKKIHRKIMKTKGDCEIPALPSAPNEFCQQVPISSHYSSHVKLCQVPAVSQNTANLLMRKATASILCHVGYSMSSAVAFDVMSDTLGDYLLRFCATLRRQQDNILMGHKIKYSDAFEETLYTHGIQGYEEFVSSVRSLTTEYTQKLDDRRQVIESEYKVICKIPQSSARSTPGHLPGVNTVNLLKGSFEPEPQSPCRNDLPPEQDSFTNDVFMHDPNGLFFGRT